MNRRRSNDVEPCEAPAGSLNRSEGKEKVPGKHFAVRREIRLPSESCAATVHVTSP